MTHMLVLAAALLVLGTRTDTFEIQAELQGLYDEISQATLQFRTESDVDEFHDVLYAPDWVFIDGAGRRHAWPAIRQDAIRALATPRPEAMTQPIKRLSIDAAGATVVVNVVTVRAIVDREGRFGRPAGVHTLTDTTPFRDRWIKIADGWRLQSREQLGPQAERVDKPE